MDRDALRKRLEREVPLCDRRTLAGVMRHMRLNRIIAELYFARQTTPNPISRAIGEFEENLVKEAYRTGHPIGDVAVNRGLRSAILRGLDEEAKHPSDEFSGLPYLLSAGLSMAPLRVKYGFDLSHVVRQENVECHSQQEKTRHIISSIRAALRPLELEYKRRLRAA